MARSARSDLAGFRRQLVEKFPGAAKVEGALRSSNNPMPFFFFKEAAHKDLKRCWAVIARLGPELERMYSVSGEVLILFSPYEDFQRRSFEALTKALRQEVLDYQQEQFGTRRFVPNRKVMLVWSPDKNLQANLSAWNADEAYASVVPLPYVPETDGRVDMEDIRTNLHRTLGARDLYRGRNPVTGQDFFGREPLLLGLRRTLLDSQSVGIFGLRRSGKTSVLREFQYRNESHGVAVCISDLEGAEGMQSFAARIGQDLLDALRRMKAYRSDTWIGDATHHNANSYADLGARLKRVAERNPDLHFVIALDEVESLRRFVIEDPVEVRTLLGTLRQACQLVPNVSLLLTGVTPEFFTKSMLGKSEVDNPLFGFVEPEFLTTFSFDETRDLLQKLGGAMQVTWEPDALELAHSVSGGFPYFARQLASASYTLAARDKGTAVVSRALVEEALNAWSTSAKAAWTEIVSSLQIHYPMAAELARSDSEETLQEWLETGEEAAVAGEALVRLGLLRSDGNSLARTKALTALQNLGSIRQRDAESVRESQNDRARVMDLVSRPEGHHLEFKSSARWDHHQKKRNPDLETAVVKTVAGFLNSEGGTLLIGVSDDGRIEGVACDVMLTRKSLDAYQAWLTGSLLGERLSVRVVSEFVRVTAVRVAENVVMEVRVAQAREVVWDSSAQGEKLYVRNGNQTRKLDGKEMAEFHTRRALKDAGADS